MTAPSLAERALAALDVEFGEQIKLRYRAICARLDGDGSLQNLDAKLAGCERGLETTRRRISACKPSSPRPSGHDHATPGGARRRRYLYGGRPNWQSPGGRFPCS